MAGIYIHVPFCEKRCSYCSFYSTIHGKQERDAFVRSLVAEMQHRKTDETIHTVYFGGGALLRSWMPKNWNNALKLFIVFSKYPQKRNLLLKQTQMTSPQKKRNILHNLV